jgi:tetratricopeptide (TPR) repeat protein
MRTSEWSWLVAAVTLCATSCAKSQGAQLRDGLHAVERERDPERLTRAGEAYALLGDSSRAIQYFTLAIENGGDEPRLFARILEICIRDKQYRAALDRAEDRLRKHPADDSLRFLIASLYVAVGERARALAELERVVHDRPEQADAHYAMAVLYRDDGDPMQADRHFREYLRISPQGQHAEEAKGGLLRSVP